MAIYNAAWAIPFLPLLGALLSLGVETQRRAAQLCVFFTGLSFLTAAVVLVVRVTHATGAQFDSLLTFFAMSPPEGATFATQFQAQVGVHVDALSASFAAAITLATFVIQAYGVTAMRGENGYRRFFCGSSILAFCSTGFVLSSQPLRLADPVGGCVGLPLHPDDAVVAARRHRRTRDARHHRRDGG